VSAAETPIVVEIEDAARALGLSRETVRQAILAGELPARRFRRKYLIPRSAIEAFGALAAEPAGPPAA